MRLKTLLLVMMVWLGACTDDESHFLNCGEGVHLEENDRSYCMYSASTVASQGDAFACPEGTLTRIDIDGAAVCTNVPDVNLVSELPPEVCEVLQTQGCVGESGTQLSITLSNPGAWAEDSTRFPVPLYWRRDQPDPNSEFFYGAGTLERDQLDIEVPMKLPEVALTLGLFAVGNISAFDPSYAISEGEIGESEFDEFAPFLRGWSANYAIIFKQDPADYSDAAKQVISDNPELNQLWFNDFEIGYSCGRCVRVEQGLDSYEPVACEEIIIEPVEDSNTIEACSWT